MVLAELGILFSLIALDILGDLGFFLIIEDMSMLETKFELLICLELLLY